jgi:hypothetical protein
MAKAKAKIEVEVDDTQVKSLKTQLREATLEAQRLASAEVVDQAALEAAVLKTAELKDRIADVNEQVAVFASGSKYEQVTNSLGQIGSAIGALDFGKAQERAGAFAKAASSITFKDAIESVKQLGSTFLTIGRALLTNPLFLLAAIIAGIVFAIYKLLDALGVIKVVMEAVGKVIGWVVQAFKDLTDWLGITDNAAKDAAASMAESFEDAAQKQEEAGGRVVQSIDNQIRAAKALGKDTEELEKKKREELAKTALARAKADAAAVKSAKLQGDLDEKEIADLEKKARLSQDAYKQSLAEIKLFEIESKAAKDEAAKKELEAEKSKQEKLKSEREKAYKEALARQKAFDAARLAAARLTRDLELEMMAEGVEKEVALSNEKYTRLIEDTKKNENLLQSEKDVIISQYESLRDSKEKELRDKKIQERKEAELAAQRELSDLLIEASGNQFLVEINNIENQSKEKLDALKKQLEDGLITQEQFNQAEIALESDKQRQLDALKGGGEGMTPIEKAEFEAEQLREIEKQRLEAGIIDYEEYAARIAYIDEQLEQKKREEDEKTKQQKIANLNAGIDAAAGALGAIGSLVEASNALQIAAAEGNEAKQEELRKKGFEQNKKFQIAQATIAGIQGVINALTAQSTIPEPFGTILKGVNAGIVAATTIANIAKIKATKYQGGGGSGAGATPSTGSSAAPSRALPNVSFQGGNSDANNLSAGGTTSTAVTINNQVTVSESEITNSQATVKNLTDSAKL